MLKLIKIYSTTISFSGKKEQVMQLIDQHLKVTETNDIIFYPIKKPSHLLAGKFEENHYQIIEAENSILFKGNIRLYRTIISMEEDNSGSKIHLQTGLHYKSTLFLGLILFIIIIKELFFKNNTDPLLFAGIIFGIFFTLYLGKLSHEKILKKIQWMIKKA